MTKQVFDKFKEILYEDIICKIFMEFVKLKFEKTKWKMIQI